MIPNKYNMPNIDFNFTEGCRYAGECPIEKEHTSCYCFNSYLKECVPRMIVEIRRLEAENAALRNSNCEKPCQGCSVRQSECLAYHVRLVKKYETLALKNAMEVDELRAQLEAYKKSGFEPCDFKLMTDYVAENSSLKSELRTAIHELGNISKENAALRAQLEQPESESREAEPHG